MVHELSLAEGILDILRQNALSQGFSRVRTVWLEVGKLSAVEPDALVSAFHSAASNTLAQDAKLEIVETLGEGQCESCSAVFPVEQIEPVCPFCGDRHVSVTGGKGLSIREMEVL